jgi:hypothetical protein
VIKIIPSFLSDTESEQLSSWIMENEKYFVDANMGGKRKTTRYLHDGVAFPELASTLRERIKQMLALEDALKPPFIQGMVASFAGPGDTCYEHTDPRWYEGHYTLHCNVITKKPKSGGNIVVDGKEFDIPKGSLVCIPVSEYAHSVTEVLGDTPRLMWIFAFCVKDL